MTPQLLYVIDGRISAISNLPYASSSGSAKRKSALIYAAVFFWSLIVFILPLHAQNAIVTENSLTGTDQSVWDIAGMGDESIQGFATDISVNKGETVHFKISTDASAYTIDIYRIGYYSGDGARLIASIAPSATLPQSQPDPFIDLSTGLKDYGTWNESAHWDVPSTAVSGIYIAKLTRTDNAGASHIAFVVRNDDSHSDLFFQTSDATWQAYNAYGGNSLYVGNTSYPGGHAAKVSYNRPFMTRSGGGGSGSSEDWLFNAEYPMIRFLERNGYDVTYTTDVDQARRGNLILNHKVFMSVGHDEYWSAEQRLNVEAARDAGVSLAFFGGNECYWKTRWENSADGSNTSYRTLVCYKEGNLGENQCNTKCDPLANTWTGLWRSGCEFPNADGCRPENSMSGQISWYGTTTAITVPDTYKSLRFWRNTGVATLGSGQTSTLGSQTLGYEWDWQQYEDSYPNDRILLSSTTQDGKTHHISLYKHSSGALVFGAGTVQWSWGLDDVHDRGNDPVVPDMQQATVNLFADMGVQPTALQAGLVAATASTDATPPSTNITNPGNGDELPAANTVSISGTSSDIGGVVAGVEVSVDGGSTWHVATGTTNWSYSWTPLNQGTIIIKVRGFDDSGNLESPGTEETSLNIISVDITAPVPPVCPCTMFVITDAPAIPVAQDNLTGIENGIKFRTTVDGYITGIRFYKGSGNSGTHIGELYNNAGSLLGQATFVGESNSGWQEVTLGSPVAVTAGTTYIASLFSGAGYYAYTDDYFSSDAVNGPLIRLGDGTDGPNGVYKYTSAPAFPDQSYQSSNYWVDVVFNTSVGPDQTPPTVTIKSPANNANAVNVNALITASFNEALDASTVNTATFQFLDASNASVSATVNYISGTHQATLTPSSSLAYSTTYTATLIGGSTDPRIKDVAGNALASNVSWSFTTSAPPPPPPDDGPGGPILVISAAANPFSRYPVEILRAEGFNEFAAKNISSVTASTLNDYDVVILGNISLSAAQVTMLSDWTNAGGTLIALRPDAQLASLLGITATGNTLADKYLLVNTASTVGAGIVNQTIQYHGTADLYTLNGATSLATLYSDATTATNNPAVTTKSVGTNGGVAVAFTYDLARSVVYTRQGNPAWAGQKRDGQIDPIRSDDLFFPDWIDFNKVAIPQADEQQHLLSNIIIKSNLHRKPLPRFWFLPNGFKAAIVMTGDDHANGGTIGRFNQYISLSSSNDQAAVDNWTAIRSTSYIYPGTPITDAQALAFQNQGFEISLHLNTGCTVWTPSELDDDFTSQLGQLAAQLPSIAACATHRTHCISWSDWASAAKTELAHGIRLDVNYYYWPESWIQDRPGMFTGSGLPMRFADLDGTLIDCYQVVTQMPDESGETFPFFCDELLDKATGAEGYYGVFCANMHTDNETSSGSDAIISSAQAHNIPVVSAKQMLTWLDGRNGSSFGSISWSNSALSFSVSVGSGANNLKGMLPMAAAQGQLISLTLNGGSVSYTTQTIKGIDYAFFDAAPGNYVATYGVDNSPPVISNIVATPHNDGTATITWTTDEVSNSRVDYSNTANSLTLNASDVASVINHTITLTGLTASTTYYYRVTSVDASTNIATSPAVPNTLSFTMPSAPCAQDKISADFALGSTGSNTMISLEDGDGSIILNPALSQEFSGTTLPSGWQSAAWPSGGSVTVSGGVLTADGAQAHTTSSFNPLRSIEFVATFSAAQFQNIGFAADGNFNSPWIVIGEGNATDGLYARTDDGTPVLLGANLIGSSHRFRIDWNVSTFVFFVDGVQITSINKTVSSNMVGMVSDYIAGGGNLQVDWLRVTPYATSGSFTSRVFDHGTQTTWGIVSWTANTPPNTSLTIETRTGNTAVPGGSWTSFTAISNGNSVGSTSQYLQYRANLSTSDTKMTPVLNDLQIACSTNSNVAPTISINPVSQTVCDGSNVSFTSSANGTPSPTAQWQKSTDNGGSWNNIQNATSSTLTFASAIGNNGNQYRAVWTNSAGSTSSSAAILTVNAQGTYYTDGDNDGYGTGPAIHACNQPAGTSTLSGDCNDANAAVKPGAAEVCNAIDDDCDGSTDEGVQSTFYRDADGDSYGNLAVTTLACSVPAGYVANSNDCNDANALIHPGATEICNGIDDDCDLQIDEGLQPTTILTQPVNQAACAGSPVTFSVTASGVNLTYQWKKGNTNISGATNSSFTMSSVVSGNAGNYKVVVSGVCGSVTSNVVTLTVNPVPVISSQPTTQTACAGSPVTFTVSVTGIGLTYQWKKGNANIGGATNSSYPIATVVTSNAGNYKVVITSTCGGSVTSNVATLTVSAAPTLSFSVTKATCTNGTDGAIDLTVTGTSGTVAYLWSNGATTQDISGLPQGTYTVAVTPSVGCSKTGSATVGHTCPKPTGLAVTGITTTSAIVNWNSTSCAVNYRVRYRLSSASTWTYSPLTAAATQNFTSLTSNSQYQVQVETFCGVNDSSGYTTTVTFTTLSSCNNATNLSTTNITSSTANLNWVSNGTPSSWTIQYRVTSSSTWNTINNIAGTATSRSLSGLMPNTSYTWRIRAKCGTITTAYSGTVSFNTLAARMDGETSALESAVLLLYPNPNNGQFVINLRFNEAINTTAKIELINVVNQTIIEEYGSVADGELSHEMTIDNTVPAGLFFVRITVNDRLYTGIIDLQR